MKCLTILQLNKKLKSQKKIKFCFISHSNSQQNKIFLQSIIQIDIKQKVKSIILSIILLIKERQFIIFGLYNQTKLRPMEEQYQSISNNKIVTSLSQIISSLQQLKIPLGLSRILQIFRKDLMQFIQSGLNMQQLINNLFEEAISLENKPFKLESMKQEKDFDEVFAQFLKVPYYTELQFNTENELELLKCRDAVSWCFHYLVHYTTLKNIPKIMVLFYKLLSWQMLNIKITNYFMLSLLLSYQNLTLERDFKIVKKCLVSLQNKGIIYVGLQLQQIPNKKKKNDKKYPISYHFYQKPKLQDFSFVVFTYLIYLSHFNKSKSNEQQISNNVNIIKKIISESHQLTSLILSFRQRFPQQQIFVCNRNLASLSACIVDNFLFKSLLNLYLEPKIQEQLKPKLYFIISTILSFDLSILTVKNLIKKLQILNNDNLKEKWKKIMQLLKQTLPNYHKSQIEATQIKMNNFSQKIKQMQKQFIVHSTSPRKKKQSQDISDILLSPQAKRENKIQDFHDVLLLDAQSFIKYSIDQDLTKVALKFRSYRVRKEQQILLKLKNQQNQIWLTVQPINNNTFQICAMRLINQNPAEMSKVLIKWNAFEMHCLQIRVQGNQLVFEFSYGKNEATTTSSIKQSQQQILKTKNIKPKQLMIGSNNKGQQCYINVLVSLSINNKQIKMVHDFKSKNINWMRQTKASSQLSLASILKKVGDLDLFFLIAYHLIRKVEDSQTLTQMLTQIINLLEYLAAGKQFGSSKQHIERKQHRFYSIRCLIWLASKNKKDPEVIFQLFRLLSIKGTKKPVQCLQILCNVGLWKQMCSFSHYKIMDKIKQYCSLLEQNQSQYIFSFMKNVILDFMIFYKHTQFVAQNLQQQYLMKHSQILKVVYDCISCLKSELVLNFIFFLLKILYFMLDRTRNTDYIDTTIGFQIANLSYRLLYCVREQQYSVVQKEKMISPGPKSVRVNKIKLSPDKSLNMLIGGHQRSQQLFINQIQQILMWINQIMYSLNNQVLYEEQKIRYYDWSWDFKQTSNTGSLLSYSNLSKINDHFKKKIKSVSQIQILTLCQYLQVGLFSFNKATYNVLSPPDYSQTQIKIFWDINLFDERISNERVFQTLKYGDSFDKIVWDDKKVCKLLSRSFNFLSNGKQCKIPHKLLESIKVQNISVVHNFLFDVYYTKCQQGDPLQRQKCAENIMYIICMIPASVYTNTQLLREELGKEKRNTKTLQFVDMHLIIKQLASQGFKLVKLVKKGDNQILTSTILAFEDSINPKLTILPTKDQQPKINQSINQNSKTNSLDLANNAWALQNVDFQQSFMETQSQRFGTISNQLMLKSLQHYKLLANPMQIQAFYKVSEQVLNKNQAKQQIEGHILNFNINIDAIIQILTQYKTPIDKANQLQNYIFFIEKHIYNFSKMILNQYIFEQMKIQKQKYVRSKRKKSFKSTKNCKIKQESEQMLQLFLKERRKNVYKMQKIWTSVQKSNKSYWQIFFKSQQKNQSVDSVCNSLKLKGLIKIDSEKRQFQLPKNITMISNKISISADSEKQMNLQGETESSIFEDACTFYQQQDSSDKDKDQNGKTLTAHEKQKNQAYRKKQRKRNQFFVLYVTPSTIYQGIINCQASIITFTENAVPDDNFYELICAGQYQKRTLLEIQKNKYEFSIHLNHKSTFIPKRYLYHDAAIQIYSQNQSKFLVFRRQAKRQEFLKLYLHLKGTILDETHIDDLASKQMQRWVNGDISNFTYLMHLNDLGGRSFNDMSQYYIFPWILTNYKSKRFNKKFVNNESNYRDLQKPMGALNPSKFQDTLTRYNETRKYGDMECFLYGSYCSNPAIICNFMVRLEPFSRHHFLLQSKQFDCADRIFYSIENQFNGCYSNSGDYKQLIPEFYSCPQFLRNRNKYKFGQRQNKEAVNNVKLPDWAYYDFQQSKITKKCQGQSQKTQPQQKFIFRMRKCLQSEYVTRHINSWIDLIFGLYTRKERAIERNNLYIPSIYKNELQKKNKEKSKEGYFIFFKQFGQLPRDLFGKNHKQYKNIPTYYKIGNSQIYKVGQLQQSMLPRSYNCDSRYITYWDEKNINILDLKNKSGLMQKIQNNVIQVPLKQQSIQQVKIISIQSNLQENKKIDFVIYLKNKKICVRQVTISTFRKKLQIKEELTSSMNFQTNSEILQIYEDHKLLILSENNIIKIYEYNINNALPLDKSADFAQNVKKLSSQQGFSITINKKCELRMNLKYQFTQHRSKIQNIGILKSYGLLVSVDSNRKVFILKINSKQMEVAQYFRLKKLTNCEQVKELHLHQMGYIIILTSLSNIHIYNLMGDYVAVFGRTTLKYINKRMEKKIHNLVQNIIQATFQNKNAINQVVNARKKSGNDIKNMQRLASCQFIESDQESIVNQTIIVNGPQSNTEVKATKQKQKQFAIKQNKSSQQQQINTIQIWNHESGQIAIGTNLGNLYRFDMFMMDDCEKINLSNYCFVKDVTKNSRKRSQDIITNSSKIQFIEVYRIGRHWQCWVTSGDQLFKIESEDYSNAEKRNQQYRKKYVMD